MRSKTFALPALLLLLSGCALIKQGTSQEIEVDTKPSGAKFEVDGVIHTTPCRVAIPKGEQALIFKAKGYKDTTFVLKTRTSSYFYWSFLFGVLSAGLDWVTGAWQEFDIDNEDGRLKTVILEPSEDNPEQLVRFSSYPAKAFIKIDGVQQQQLTGTKGVSASPIIVLWNDKQNSKKVKLILAEHEEVELPLRRGDKTFHVDLIPVPKRPKVVFESTPPGAEVFIDGVRASTQTTPVTIEQVWRHGDTIPRKIEFRKAGYKPDTGHVLRDSGHVKVTGKLDVIVRTVPLKVDCWPAGSTIEVNGKPAGESPAVINLPWSVEQNSYTIRFSLPGYEPQEVIIVEAQNETPLTRRLKSSLPRYP